MPDNSPIIKYGATTLLVARLAALVSGPWAWLLSLVAPYVINWLAMKGVYVIDVVGAQIKTNMQKKDWIKIAGDGWAEVDQGNLTPEEGMKIDNSIIAAFDNFVVFDKVHNSGHS